MRCPAPAGRERSIEVDRLIEHLRQSLVTPCRTWQLVKEAMMWRRAAAGMGAAAARKAMAKQAASYWLHLQSQRGRRRPRMQTKHWRTESIVTISRWGTWRVYSMSGAVNGTGSAWQCQRYGPAEQQDCAIQSHILRPKAL